MKVDGTDAQGKVQKASGRNDVRVWIKEHSDDFLQVIPKGTVAVERFIQSALLCISNTPALLQCEPVSIIKSIKESAALGLEVGSLLGQAYLIPYRERGVMTCHFQVGYKGLIVLARRSNTIKTIAAEVICENDIFDVNYGSGRRLIHKIDIHRERGPAIGYYCMVELVNGGEQFAVMGRKEIEKHRDKFSKVPGGVWATDFDAMAKKTVVIQALKLCPISIQALEIVNAEELKEAEIDKESMKETNIMNRDAPKENALMDLGAGNTGESESESEKEGVEVLRAIEREQKDYEAGKRAESGTDTLKIGTDGEAIEKLRSMAKENGGEVSPEVFDEVKGEGWED